MESMRAGSLIMSPRKARYAVEEHIVQGLRDRRRKILMGPYLCPACGKDGLRILIAHETEKVYAKCSCRFQRNLEYSSGREGIDYYNDLFDTD